MKEPDIIKYCNLMEEIKKRTAVIDVFLSGSKHALFKATTIESTCLQLRKILELIAMGSLVANKKAFSKVYENFSKCWNAEYIFKDIGRINTEFIQNQSLKAQAQRQAKKWIGKIEIQTTF